MELFLSLLFLKDKNSNRFFVFFKLRIHLFEAYFIELLNKKLNIFIKLFKKIDGRRIHIFILFRVAHRT